MARDCHEAGESSLYPGRPTQPRSSWLLWQPGEADEWPNHPAIAYFRRFFTLDEPLAEETWQRVAAAYYGVCTYLDAQIGRVLAELSSSGLNDNTRVIYTADHGEALGARGLSGKFTLYDESANVPLIVAGPDVPRGKTVTTPVSLVDAYPTILEAAGVSLLPSEQELPGQSLWSLAASADAERTIFAEYHALGSHAGSYMLRDRRFKYIYYVDGPPQLFDLHVDPAERNNLAASADHQLVLARMDARLRSLLDPEAVDAHAKQEQRAKIAEHGGIEAVRARGAFTNSPTPDESPQFKQYGS